MHQSVHDVIYLQNMKFVRLILCSGGAYTDDAYATTAAITIPYRGEIMNHDYIGSFWQCQISQNIGHNAQVTSSWKTFPWGLHPGKQLTNPATCSDDHFMTSLALYLFTTGRSLVCWSQHNGKSYKYTKESSQWYNQTIFYHSVIQTYMCSISSITSLGWHQPLGGSISEKKNTSQFIKVWTNGAL